MEKEMSSIYDQYSEDEIIANLKEHNTRNVLDDLPAWNESHPDDPPVGFAMLEDCPLAEFITKNSKQAPEDSSVIRIMAGCISRRAFLLWLEAHEPKMLETLNLREGDWGTRFPILYGTRNQLELQGVNNVVS